MFFALKGDNFNGNTYANQALSKGAKYVVIDEEQYKNSNQAILVEDVLKTHAQATRQDARSKGSAPPVSR